MSAHPANRRNVEDTPSGDWVSARITGAFFSGLSKSLVNDAEHDGLRRAANHILARFGVSTDSVCDPNNRLSHELALSLLGEAVRITGDANLGLHVAEQVALEALDLVTYLGRHCDTVGDAFDTVCRYHELIHTRADVGLEVRGSETWLQFGVADDLPADRQATEFSMALALMAARQATGVASGLSRALFSHPRPADLRAHHRIFAAPLEFDAPRSALVFSTAFLNSRLPTAEPRLRSILEQHAEMLLEEARSSCETLAPIVSEVRGCIRNELRGVQPTLETVAAGLGLSTRTLRRRLAEANTTYRQQLDDILAARALDLLAAGAATEEIAHALGFSDASALRRAFKRWTGHSPATHPIRTSVREHAQPQVSGPPLPEAFPDRRSPGTTVRRRASAARGSRKAAQ